MPRIDLVLDGRTHPIIIERGLRLRAGHMLRQWISAGRALVIADARVMPLHGQDVLKALADAGIEVMSHVMTSDESRKTLDSVRDIYTAMARMKLERGELVVSLGGGLVGDVAGFAASTWHRGVPIVHMPTTLLAMVDAAIGGKTGVNFQWPGGGLAKNLIGAFHQAVAVFSDPETLGTLEARELRCGLAECVKHAIIADASLLNWIEAQLVSILKCDLGALEMLIDRCARIKAAIVQDDERETGRRALLNLGHTFAHIIEPIAELQLKHGEAVSIGLVAAMHVAIQTDRMSNSDADRVRSFLERIGLPVRINQPIPIGTLTRAMSHDKKVIGGRVRLIVPRGIGAAEIVDDVPATAVEDAWRHIGAH
jgi:3-dehydroquinate synthase